MQRSALFRDLDLIIDDKFKKIPMACPVCDILFAGTSDHNVFREFKCCEACRLQWAWSNKEKWLAGWRPAPEMVTEFRKNRMSVPSYTIRGKNAYNKTN
jgi:hypothetical protein